MTEPLKIDLSGRVALVTGGGTGIGKAIAATLHAAGASVALTGRRHDVLTEAARELSQANQTAGAPDRLFVKSADVLEPQSLNELVGAVVSKFGHLDILVNNAGVARGGPLEIMSDDEINLVVDVDLKGPIHAIRAALPELEKRKLDGGACVINISTSLSQAPIKNFSVYTAAKGGLDVLTKALALELADRGIRVNAICPGIVETPIFETMMPAEAVPEFLGHFNEAVQLGRAGRPHDIAAAAAFLCSQAASYITGAILTVDGGLSLAADGK